MGLLVSLGRFLYATTLTYGVIGLAAGTFLESFGVPTAAAVIDLTAGILILSGRTTFLEALAISDLGLVLGSLASYYVGKTGARLFKHLQPPDRAKRHSRVKQLLDRYGDKSILLAQLFGPARTWISYPAGAAGMDIKKFAFYSAVGGAVYCSIVITASLYLTDFIRTHLKTAVRLGRSPMTVAVVLLLLAIILFIRRFAARKSD